MPLPSGPSGFSLDEGEAPIGAGPDGRAEVALGLREIGAFIALSLMRSSISSIQDLTGAAAAGEGEVGTGGAVCEV